MLVNVTALIIGIDDDDRPLRGNLAQPNDALPPPSTPESPPESEESDCDDDDDAEVAGFDYCSTEAIRYLLEQEKLSTDHPLVQQLQQHLLQSRRSSSSSSNSSGSGNNRIANCASGDLRKSQH